MKTKNTLHLYLADGLKEKLQAIADADRRSMSYKVQELIEQAYDDLVQQTKDDLKR